MPSMLQDIEMCVVLLYSKVGQYCNIIASTQYYDMQY